MPFKLLNTWKDGWTETDDGQNDKRKEDARFYKFRHAINV